MFKFIKNKVKEKLKERKLQKNITKKARLEALKSEEYKEKLKKQYIKEMLKNNNRGSKFKAYVQKVGDNIEKIGLLSPGLNSNVLGNKKQKKFNNNIMWPYK